MEEDAKVFGKDTLVFCEQHKRPHSTGWCSVPARDKVALKAQTMKEAYDEAFNRGLNMYGEQPVWHPAYKGKKSD